MPKVMDKTDTQKYLEERITAFDDAIRAHEFLEIDGDIEGEDLDSHIIKVINHNTEEAHSVSLGAVLKHKPSSIIHAFETGVTIRLFGITRIVGYYSRVNNWNRSKKVELADRHKGSYKLSECEGL